MRNFIEKSTLYSLLIIIHFLGARLKKVKTVRCTGNEKERETYMYYEEKEILGSEKDNYVGIKFEF
jgi:hypothetical protein